MQNLTITESVDFSHEVSPCDAGFDPDRLELLIKAFESQVNIEKLHPSAQLVVLRYGKVVLSRAMGISRSKPVSRKTPYLTFSVSKAFTGVCIHKLIEERKIELDAKVADYWPEYGCNGKENTTVRQVLLHQAGIPAPRLYSQIILWSSWRKVTKRVAQYHSVYPPGEKTAYHMLNYGFILGELVRRVTGMQIGDYLQETFLNPLGLKYTWMPLPRREIKNSPLLKTPDRSLKIAAFLFNLPLNRHALMPAATLHSNAEGLAIFYQMLLNGGTFNGRQYLKPETVAFATNPGYEGFDHATKSYMRWGYGFHLGGVLKTPEGEKGMGMGKGSSQAAFGHYGMASTIAFADPGADLVFVFTTNGMLVDSKQRNRALLDALWDAIQ
ncbi:MAG: beta-lactamase family protein [Anaerolineaceae bacterium]|nr:beta-lactamase family protein [Anaerolineaceae bacterium]